MPAGDEVSGSGRPARCSPVESSGRAQTFVSTLVRANTSFPAATKRHNRPEHRLWLELPCQNPALSIDLGFPQRLSLALKATKDDPISRKSHIRIGGVEPLLPKVSHDRRSARLPTRNINEPPLRCSLVAILRRRQDARAVGRPDWHVRVLDRGQHFLRRAALKSALPQLVSKSVKQCLPGETFAETASAITVSGAPPEIETL